MPSLRQPHTGISWSRGAWDRQHWSPIPRLLGLVASSEPQAGAVEGKVLVLSGGRLAKASSAMRTRPSWLVSQNLVWSPKPEGLEMFATVEGHMPPVSGSLGAAESANKKVAISEKGAVLVTPPLWAEMFASDKNRPDKSNHSYSQVCRNFAWWPRFCYPVHGFVS